MKFFVDLDLLQLVESPGYRNPVQTVRMKRGDGASLELRFYRGTEPVTLAAGALIKFGAKPVGDYTGDLIVESSDFILSGADPVYSATLTLNSDALNALIKPAGGPEKSEITLMGEMTWRTTGLPESTRTFSIIVENDVIREDVTFFGKSTASAFGSDGTSIIRCVIRSSLLSQADADAKAKARSIELVNSIAAGGQEPERYLYQVRSYEERLLRVLYETGYWAGSLRPPIEIARITENRYGAEVLNANSVMFVDVDTAPEIPTKPDSAEDKSTAPLISEDAANSLLDAFCVENPAFGFRVYKTFAGMRYICTSGQFDPTSKTVKAIFIRLNADQSYRALCKIQKCFRARLTPKPWRVIGLNGDRTCFRRMDFSNVSYTEFRLSYLTAIEGHSTCQYQRSVGNPIAHPSCLQIIAFHDTRTKSSTALPLA